MLRVGHDTLPFASWQDLAQLFCDELASLLLESLVLRDIDNKVQLFFVNSKVIVHLSFVTDSLESV